MMDIIKENQWIKNQLQEVTAFWLKNGMDKENGGVYTCLDRKGEVYSTDKLKNGVCVMKLEKR